MGNLNQFININAYHREYLKLINRYQDITRHSIFCIYFNISDNVSIFDQNTTANYGSSDYGIVYNKYQMTPVYEIGEERNSIELDKNKEGLQFTGDLRLITYTIRDPKVGDLVIFPYDKQNLSIFRVNTITIVSGTKKSKTNHFFELNLEYAPIKTIDNLQINMDYIYDSNRSIYVTKEQFLSFMNDISELSKKLKDHNFDKSYELYYYIEDGVKVFNYKENQDIFNFLKFHGDYFEIFINHPYGMMGDISNLNINYESETEISCLIKNICSNFNILKV